MYYDLEKAIQFLDQRIIRTTAEEWLQLEQAISRLNLILPIELNSKLMKQTIQIHLSGLNADLYKTMSPYDFWTTVGQV